MNHIINERKWFDMTSITSGVAGQSSKIRCWMDHEIDRLKRNYFKNKLSQEYWPRPMRNFLKLLLEYVRENEAMIAILHVEQTDLNNLIDILAQSTRTYIQVAYKELIRDLVHQIRFRTIDFSVKKPHVQHSVLAWPNDVISNADLAGDMSSFQLRKDVLDYIFDMIDRVIPPEQKSKISYFSGEDIPIHIEVEQGAAGSLIDEIRLISIDLKKTCELRPVDVITVIESTDNLKSIIVHEESLSCGSIWNVGTLGGILMVANHEDDDPQYVGVTCAHVLAGSRELLSDLVVEKVKCPELDIGFFKMDVAREPRLYNIMPLSDEDFSPVIGESVYKIGGATGLTIGKLSNFSTSFRCPRSRERYDSCVEIQWDSECPFAFHGDCGALYCLKRADAFIPIGIHRVSGINFSYGSNFRAAMQYLHFQSIVFPNPQYWRSVINQTDEGEVCR